VDFNSPDPLAWVKRTGSQTEKLGFMVACRSALPSPEFYLEQMDSAAALLPGRVLAEFACEHAPLEKLREFLDACRRLRPRGLPPIFVTGNSSEAAELGIRYGSCVWRSPCAEQEVRGQAGPLLHFGVEVGFLAFLIARENRPEAIEAVRRLRASFPKFDNGTRAGQSGEEPPSDETAHAPGLWTGLNPVPDAPRVALFGSFEEVAGAILRFERCGITRFLFMGWPAREEMDYFRQGVRPLLEAGRI
jgi:alkanesulfonate monooxygenase SsuD/methylene tetrahydromethanopterin reductase-like flavin-dependent oxidoreductase (luciferase family)